MCGRIVWSSTRKKTPTPHAQPRCTTQTKKQHIVRYFFIKLAENLTSCINSTLSRAPRRVYTSTLVLDKRDTLYRFKKYKISFLRRRVFGQCEEMSKQISLKTCKHNHCSHDNGEHYGDVTTQWRIARCSPGVLPHGKM